MQIRSSVLRHIHLLKPAALLAILAPTWCAASASADSPDWPAFRGSRGDGIAREAGIFSHGEGFSLEIGWKKTLGSGYSGVVVADGRVVTMFSDGTSDVAVALDPSDGRELWRYTIDETYKGHDGSHDGTISTPALAGGRVFGLSPRGILFALDAGSGKELWKTDLAKDREAVMPHYGFSTSPLVIDGVLVVLGASKDALACGFDPTTGKHLWSAGKDKVAYQSPLPYKIDGRSNIVAAGNERLFVIDPRDGGVVHDYAHGGSGERGSQSLIPVPAGKDRLFVAHKSDASAMLRFEDGGDAPKVRQEWEAGSIGKSYAIPVFHEGHIYGYNSRIFTCLDAGSGETAWRSRQPGDGFMILVDGHLVSLTKKGTVHVAEANSTGYRDVTRLAVFDDLVWTPPSFANGSIFARSLGEIARIDIRRGASTAVAAASESTMQADIQGSRFDRFLETLKSETDKKSAIDAFLAKNKKFPMIERDGLVHFVYRGAAKDVAIAGDIVGASNEQPMTRVEGTDLHYFSMRLEPDARVNYAIIKDFEPIVDPLNPRKTNSEIFGKDMELNLSEGGVELSWIAMPDWKAPGHFDTPDASRRGRIETHELQSEALEAKHKVDVYLPAGYEGGSGRYPVAYVHSGSAALEHGQMQKMLDNLIGKRISPVIVVFVHHAVSVQSPDPYVKMFARELVPFVDRTYRTVANPDGRANVGSGYGAVAAMFCTFGDDGVANKLGAQSPFTLGTKRIEPKLKSASEQPLTIYLDWGLYDLRNPSSEWSIVDTGRATDKLLREKGYSLTGGEANDGTGWSSWKNRADDLFAALFPLKAGS